MFTSGTELIRLLKRLDEALVHSLEVYLVGGANLLARNLISRGTMDMDVIWPEEFSQEVIEAITSIAREERVYDKWINTMPSSDAQFLTKGWKKRCDMFFSGEHLTVLLVSRKDIVGLKIAAAMDRDRDDARDLLEMKLSEEEWDFGHRWARNYDGNPDWAGQIDLLVEELQRKQRG